MNKLSQALAGLKRLPDENNRQAPAAAGNRHLGTTSQGLSDEQQQILASGARLIKVQAYAGSGKTTLLQGFAEKTVKAKGLYLAFNKSLAQEASLKFPSHIECRTHNSMALRTLLKTQPDWQNMSKEKIGEIGPLDIIKTFEVAPLLAKLSLATLRRFIHSTDFEISAKNFPAADARFLLRESEPDPTPAVTLANRIWREMTNPRSPLPLPHDGYLKLWALSPTQLPYDYVLIDESQDSNPAFLQGMTRQKCRQIYVGDEHQSIYSFRGAINALRHIEDAAEFTMGTTYRFGSSIANLANTAIRLKNLKGQLSCARNAPPSHILAGHAPLGTHPLYLARTNAGMFDKAIELANQGKYFCLVGQTTKLHFPHLHELLALADGNQNNAGIYAGFASLNQLIEHADEHMQIDLAMQARTVKKYGSTLHSHLARIQNKQLNLEKTAPHKTPQLATVHQAKGLEASWIEILDDFPAPRQLPPAPTPEEEEEINILYVAITRARHGLATGPGVVAAWATRSQEGEKEQPERDNADLFSPADVETPSTFEHEPNHRRPFHTSQWFG